MLQKLLIKKPMEWLKGQGAYIPPMLLDIRDYCNNWVSRPIYVDAAVSSQIIKS